MQSPGYTPWGGSSPWVLGNSTETWSSEGGSQVKTQTCYQGQTGFLAWTRTHRNGSGPQATDVLTVFTRDGQGNVTREEHYGGDSGGLPATSQTGSCTLSGLPTTDYRIDHGYQSGSRRASQYTRANGTAMPFFSLNLAIDASTGRPVSSTDPAGIATSFEYDGLGRLTWSKPASGHDAWTEYAYAKATSSSALAKVTIRRRANGSKTGAVREEAEIGFDAFGRVSQDRKKLPGGVWATVATRYNAMGWVFDVSERMAGTPTKGTRHLDYDPFGRPRTIRPADSTGANGFAHDVQLSYAGARTVTREVGIGTGPFSGGSVGESTQAVTEVYDRQGRLFKVREPSGAGGALIDTTYGYDAAGRLTSVSTPAGGTTQNRSFNYDGRGFLISEQHPEKGAGGNGTVTYSGYDARGHATRRLEGTANGLFDVTFVYDRAERLTLMRETGGAQRPLKEYTYDTGGGTWGNGKRVTAVRYNHVVPPWNTVEVTVAVTETTTFNGRGGRPSARTTAAATGQSFSQSWVYNDLGQVSSLTYPSCDATVPTCSSPAVAPARTVSPTYADGLLTAVPGYATSISYHPNGSLNQVVHANGVTWTQGLDPDSMGRPASITANLGSATLWTTGTYRYDGAGNITVIGPNDSGQSDHFVYDPVSRLAQSTTYAPRPTPGTGYQPYRQNYTFDPFGNLVQIDTQVGTGSWQTRTIGTVASTNRISGLAYDAAGNQLAWGTFSYGWDSTSRMRYMDGGGLDKIYLYTADDERIWTYDSVPEPDQETFTLRDLDGKVLRTYRSAGGPAGTWTWLGDHVYRGGTLLATVRSAPEGTRHLHPDHLGTPRLITDSAGNQVAYHAYYPFGEEATVPGQDDEPMKFTGHERDLHLDGQTDDLDYMHARFCSPMTGRFLGLDPLGGLQAKPQTWNLHAYVGGNPVIWTDPYGLRGESPSDPWTDEITVCEEASTGKPCLRPIPESSDFEAEYQRFLRGFDSYKHSSPGRVQSALDWLNGEYEERFAQMAAEGHHTAAFIDYFALEMLFPETTGELAADVAMTFVPPLRAGKGLSRNFDWIIKKLGISPQQARSAILGRVHGSRGVLGQLSGRNLRKDIFVGVIGVGEGCGISLSSDLLRTVGALGLSLEFDIYD